jgi:predicted phosphodiesterase
MRIAVLADIHGNLPALRAVLGELDRDPVDAVVVAGDVVGGPLPLEALDGGWRDTLASWPIRHELDGVCFCHGSPRCDDEILTRVTPVTALLDALAGVDAALVVGGHTHQQVRRELGDGRAYVNAGSVGMPYEGRPGAFGLRVDDGVAERRRTDYDVDAAAAELRASGYPDVEDMLADSLLRPVDADEVTAFFERGRGDGL